MPILIFGGQANAYHPNAVYRLNVDTDNDARADIAFQFHLLGSKKTARRP